MEMGGRTMMDDRVARDGDEDFDGGAWREVTQFRAKSSHVPYPISVACMKPDS